MFFVKIFFVLFIIFISSQLTVQSGDNVDYWFIFNRGRKQAGDAGYGAINSRPIVGNFNGEPCEYSLSRHHIIAYETLRDFFKTSIGEGEDRRVRDRLLDLLRDLAANVNHRMTPPPIPSTAFDEMGNLDPNFRPVFGPDPLPVPLQRLHGRDATVAEKVMAALATWMPFNWFQGPAGANRKDDPTTGFEENAGRIVGANNLQTLRDTRDLMLAYNNARKFEDFNNAMDNLTAMLRVAPNGYRDFTMNDWVQVRSKKPKKLTKKFCQFRLKLQNEQ